MKTKSTIIATYFLISILSLQGQDSIPNSGFEQWTDIYTPISWETTNIFLPPGNYPCSRTNDSYEGDYALELKTVNIDGTIIPGVATLGEIILYGTQGGIPFTEMPTAMRAHIKHPSTGDNVLIALEFFKNGSSIGGGVFQTTDSIPDYTEIIIPISFSKIENPDTMNISIVSDPAIQGSTLTIDNLSFDIQTTAKEVTETNDDIHIYPNPASTIFNIRLPENRKYEIIVMNDMGNIIEKRESKTGLEKFETVNYPSGLYFINLISNGNQFLRKIIVR